jgi:hypothetical protein
MPMPLYRSPNGVLLECLFSLATIQGFMSYDQLYGSALTREAHVLLSWLDHSSQCDDSLSPFRDC